MDLASLFNTATLINTVNTSTIVILAALGCLLTDQTGMMNIGIDGMMVIGAFTAVMGSWLSGSWVVGLLLALAVGMLFGLLYGIFVIRFHSDEFIIGVALNIFAVALTTFMLRSIPGQTGGAFHPTTGFISTLPSISITGSGGIPVNIPLLVPAAFILTAVVWVLLYRTPLGFWLHAAGENPESLRSVGRSPERMKYIGSVLCGFFCGMSGSYLSLGYLSTFTENMSASKGYVAVACVIFGRSNPVLVTLACLLFGLIDAAGLRMENLIDPTLTKSFPYLGTILMMLVIAVLEQTRKRKKT